ncbi:hypothetical protein BDZ89DRAFT_1045259 [Hymenopellis radicata]|nr:hypothetical protein BDZ89DRAFT_1045259 [Hymenopellis radicata]
MKDYQVETWKDKQGLASKPRRCTYFFYSSPSIRRRFWLPYGIGFSRCLVAAFYQKLDQERRRYRHVMSEDNPWPPKRYNHSGDNAPPYYLEMLYAATLTTAFHSMGILLASMTAAFHTYHNHCRRGGDGGELKPLDEGSVGTRSIIGDVRESDGGGTEMSVSSLENSVVNMKRNIASRAAISRFGSRLGRSLIGLSRSDIQLFFPNQQRLFLSYVAPPRLPNMPLTQQPVLTPALEVAAPPANMSLGPKRLIGDNGDIAAQFASGMRTHRPLEWKSIRKEQSSTSSRSSPGSEIRASHEIASYPTSQTTASASAEKPSTTAIPKCRRPSFTSASTHCRHVCRRRTSDGVPNQPVGAQISTAPAASPVNDRRVFNWQTPSSTDTHVALGDGKLPEVRKLPSEESEDEEDTRGTGVVMLPDSSQVIDLESRKMAAKNISSADRCVAKETQGRYAVWATGAYRRRFDRLLLGSPPRRTYVLMGRAPALETCAYVSYVDHPLSVNTGPRAPRFYRGRDRACTVAAHGCTVAQPQPKLICPPSRLEYLPSRQTIDEKNPDEAQKSPNTVEVLLAKSAVRTVDPAAATVARYSRHGHHGSGCGSGTVARHSWLLTALHGSVTERCLPLSGTLNCLTKIQLTPFSLCIDPEATMERIHQYIVDELRLASDISTRLHTRAHRQRMELSDKIEIKPMRLQHGSSKAALS